MNNQKIRKAFEQFLKAKTPAQREKTFQNFRHIAKTEKEIN